MTADEIIAMIEKHPHGLTTAQAAQLSGMTPASICTRLSKLADYGKIARRQKGQWPPNNAATWLPKQNGAASS